MPSKITKTDDEWREMLTPEQYEVTAREGPSGHFPESITTPRRMGLQLRLLRSAPLPLGGKVRLGDGLAELLGPGCPGKRRGAGGQQPFYASDGG